MDASEGAKAVGTAGAGGLAADIAEGSGLDIASKAVGDAVAQAQSVLAGLDLSLPFGTLVDVGVTAL